MFCDSDDVIMHMLSDFLELLLYPSLLFIVPFIAVVIMLGINDYMDSKEEKLKR
jgi:hypothetical protein